MTRFAFTVTGSVHVDDPATDRSVGGSTFSIDGHEVHDPYEAADAIEALLRTALRTGVSHSLGRGAELGSLHVNVVEVPEVDLA